jgi:hypothetical protein
MTGGAIEERRFTDREVREILKRAVEAPSRGLIKSEGLSLAELQAIGEEVGIDPARVEDAARAVESRGVDRSGRLLGAPTVLNYERRISGSLAPEDTPEVLSVIRRTMGRQGEVNDVHGSLEWSAKGDSGERYVTLSSRDGTATIRGSANLTNAAVLTYLPAGIIGLITSIVGVVALAESGDLLGLVVSLAVLPVLYLVLRAVFRTVVGRDSARLQRTVDELARLAEGSEP